MNTVTFRLPPLKLAFFAMIFLAVPASMAATTGEKSDTDLSRTYREHNFPDGKTIRVGVSHNPPIGIHGKGAPPTGFVVDIIRNVAKRKSWNLTYIEQTWPELLKLLGAGKIDLLGGVAYTPTRAKQYNFSNEAAANNWAVVYRRKGITINGIADLSGKRVALTPRGVHTVALHNLANSFEFSFEAIPAKNYADTLALVDSGRADSGVVARTFHILHGSKYKALATNVQFNPIELRFAAPKGTGKQILAALDTYISSQKNDPSSQYRQMLARWFEGPRKDFIPTWVYWAGFSIVMLLLLSVGFILTLRKQVAIITKGLATSEKKYRSIFENAIEGIFQSTPEGRFISANAAMAKILAYESPEDLMSHVTDIGSQLFCDPAERDACIAVLKSGGEFSDKEIQWKRKDGTHVWVSISVQLIIDDNGQPCLEGSLRDISDRRLAEQALRESESRLRSIIDNAPFSLSLKDRNGQYIEANLTFLKSIRKQKSEIVGRIAEQIYSTEFGAQMSQMDEKIISGKPLIQELVELGADFESPGIREVTKFPIIDETDEITGTGTISIDVSEREQAVGALRRSEERYALAILGTNDGIWERNFVTGDIYRSSRWWEILGYEPNGLSSSIEAFEQVIHPDDRALCVSAMKAHIETRVPFDTEYRMRQKSGEYIWVSAKGQAIWDQNGKPLRMAGSFSDISKRMQAETALGDSEELIQAISENSPSLIYLKDKESRILKINAAYEKLYGVTQKAAFGKQGYEWLGKENVEAFIKRDKKVISENQTIDSEFDFKFPDGKIATIQSINFPVADRQGRIIGIGGIATNITERKQAENQLRESEERFRSMFEGGAIANIVINESGIIQDANPATTKIFGYDLGEMRGKNISMLMPEPDSINHDSYLENYLKTGNAKVIGIGREVTGLRKNGETFPMHLSVAGLRLDDYQAFLGTVTDLTEYKALENQLLHAQKLEAIGQLTGGVAHDFNNMLAVTMANAQMLEETLKDDEDGLAMTRSIVKASQRGAELTHRLLAFSRKQTLESKSTDLGELCKGMNDLIKRTLGEIIEIDITVGDDLWKVSADAGQVENAVLNLAINASHAMTDGGKLTIKIENEHVTNAQLVRRWDGKLGDYVAINVTDTGTGMPPDVIAKVFEPFFTTKEIGKGSGLGLSMVHGFVQQSGGFVIIESEEGKGTTVSILLPKAELNETVPEVHTTDDKIQHSHGETVLLVEDEIAVREATAKILDRLGYVVLTAEDGTSALKASSNSERIDFLLSDMVLPGGMNGIEIFEQIRRQRPDMKCLFMSGYAPLPGHLLPAGTEILSKPVALMDLATKMRQIIDA